ncbi:hypothetical protein Pan97_22650 [Bremerella volcania]|uniref:Uncharacterized protein n=1 Tax=Bremerella volcania TaxID=2527984 RepID=A0A518C7M9_9BACT|nr:hypothetical protein [Bremerella volcania]QDU75236.1 hypothetical protein Pan97_22650 [Bremerella volcania]
MRESIKAFLALLMIIGLIAAVFAWAHDRPDQTTWVFRIGGPISSALALGLLLRLHLRRDLEHDYLRSVLGTYFNRDGFCFGFIVRPINGVAYIEAYFQSQYDQPSVGRIALRPARGFFLTRANIDAITFEIECPASGFGFVRMAIPIPEELQGKRQSFEVGASVQYPNGKGRRIRFYDGIFLRSNSDFGDSFGTALALAGTATGMIVLSNPATTKVPLPRKVSDSLSESAVPQINVLWQQGEQPLAMPG